MNKHSFESLCTNCDVLLHIYKMLHFEDQLRLAQVSEDLKNVFENFIWTVRYRTLIVYRSKSQFLVTNETNVHRKLLTYAGFEAFIRLYHEEVHELNLYCPIDIRPFRRITALRCYGAFFGLEFIEFVAEKFPYLQSFEARGLQHIDTEHIFAKHKGVVLAHQESILADECVKSLLQMQSLRDLHLDYSCGSPHKRIKYHNFCEIISEMKLSVLKLSFEIESDGANSYPEFTKPLSLNELDIKVTLQCKKWAINFPSFMDIFTNLTILTLTIPDHEAADDTTMATITKYCQKLEKLKLHFVHFCTNMKSFATPPSLSELFLERCYGLTHRNLRQILSETSIIKFKSQHTEYEGLFEDFAISSSIQSLDVDTIDMVKFQLAYNRNENLKSLRWYYRSQQRVLQDRAIFTGVPLATCLNLETLILKDSHISVNILEELKYLHTLRTCLRLPQDWSNVTALLQHSSLHELIIEIKESESKSQPPSGLLQTNVKIIKLNYYSSFAEDLDFWLDLFSQNTKIKINFFDLFLNENNVRKLIYHEKFPVYLKTTDIYGFTINCNELRRNFDATMMTLRGVRFMFGVDDNKSDDWDKFGIILRRK